MSLAEDLVRAVFETLCPVEDQAYYSGKEIRGWRKDARAAVAVTLRGVADWYESGEDASVLGAGGFRALASRVERGETGGAP